VLARLLYGFRISVLFALALTLFGTVIGILTGALQGFFGGKTDCGNVNDLWSFDPATDAWTNVERAFSGESCLRSGKQGCTSLCF
jgi:uncharacterized membrane protein